MTVLRADGTAVGGIAFVTVPGGPDMRLVGALKYKPGEVDREPAPGMDGGHGFIEKPTISIIQGSFRDSGGLSVGALRNLVGVTVVAELINGKVVSGSNMWTAAAEEVDAAEGTMDIVFHTWGGLSERLAA